MLAVTGVNPLTPVGPGLGRPAGRRAQPLRAAPATLRAGVSALGGL